MTGKLKDILDANFIRQPPQEKLILILTAAVFLPFYITIPAILAAFIFFASDRKMLRELINSPFSPPSSILCVLVIIVPLFYHNYLGFLCGVMLNIFIVLSFNINRIVTGDLFEIILSLGCFMSLLCGFLAMAERITGFRERVMVFTDNPNYYAYIVQLAVLIAFYKYFYTRKRIYILTIGVNLAALLMTECRSSWFAQVCGLLLFFLLTGKKKSFSVLILTASAILYAICSDPYLIPRYGVIDQTITDRLYIWNRAFSDFLNHPVFGRGLLAFYQESGTSLHAHNLFIELLECTGIVGTSIFAFFFILILRELISARRYGGKRVKARSALLLSLIASTLAHGVTDMPVTGLQTGLFFSLILALRPKLNKNGLQGDIWE